MLLTKLVVLLILITGRYSKAAEAASSSGENAASYDHPFYPYVSDHQTKFILNNHKTLSMEFHEHENRNFQFYRQQQMPLLEHCEFELTNETGILHSPMFPEKLRTNRSITCIWRIHSPTRSTAIELNIQVANLRVWSSAFGNCSDQLVITYETNSKQTFKRIVMNSNTLYYPKKLISPRSGSIVVNLTICATQSSCPIFQAPINTSSNSTKSTYQPTRLMAIVAGKPTFFEPKYELITQPITGFYANYRLVNNNCSGCGVGDPVCSETHQCDSECGMILSINYPLHYKNNHRCKWLITGKEITFFE